LINKPVITRAPKVEMPTTRSCLVSRPIQASSQLLNAWLP